MNDNIACWTIIWVVKVFHEACFTNYSNENRERDSLEIRDSAGLKYTNMCVNIRLLYEVQLDIFWFKNFDLILAK